MSKGTIPEKFHAALGEFGVQGKDDNGTPVAWGFPILEKLGEELWAELGNYGKLTYFRLRGGGQWALVTKSLTREEAIAEFGPVTDETYGPKGGWKSVTFGTTTFTSKELKAPK